jgi:hypothetical protein
VLRRIVVPALVALVVLGHGTGDAAAAWRATATGAGLGAALVMPRGLTPTGKASTVLFTKTFTVSWPANAAGPVPVTGYVVLRYAGGATTGAAVSSGTCQSKAVNGVYPADTAATTQSCTDTANTGTGTQVSYTVTPVYGTWRGTESPPSVAA